MRWTVEQENIPGPYIILYIGKAVPYDPTVQPGGCVGWPKSIMTDSTLYSILYRIAV